MIDLGAVLRPVVAALEASGAGYVIVGSTAAAAWGVARTTRDVDLVATISGDIGRRFLEVLDDSELYVPTTEALRTIETSGSFNILHPTTGGKVDVFVSSDAFARERIERRIRGEAVGVPAWLDTAEDVVLAKLVWRRESRSETQWRDCAEIVAVQELDREYLRRWGVELNITEDLESLLTEVGRHT